MPKKVKPGPLDGSEQPDFKLKRQRQFIIDPPEKVNARARKARYRLSASGKWGQLCKFALDHPGQWAKSDPIRTRKNAEQYASDIRREYKPIRIQDLRHGQEGKWVTEWGIDKDHLDLPHYYVWVMWERRVGTKKGRNMKRREGDKDGTK